MKFPWWFLWPRHDEILDANVFDVQPPIPYDGPTAMKTEAPTACLHFRLADARDCATCGPTVADEIARVAPPRLRVWQHRVYGDWWWRVGLHGDRSERGVASSHAEALAVGLAALETASMTSRT